MEHPWVVVLSVLMVAYNVVYWFFYRSPVKLSYHHQAEHSVLYFVHEIASLHSTFYPASWIPGGFRQTLFTPLSRRNVDVNYERQELTGFDGGVFCVDWLTNTPGKRGGVVLFVVPGAVGDSGAGYCKTIATTCLKRVDSVCVFNHRGNGGTRITTARTYNGFDVRDIETALTHIKDDVGATAIIAVGVSLGANLLLRHAGTHGEASKASCMMLISNPFTLSTASAHFEGNRLTRWIISFALSRILRKRILADRQLFENTDVDLDRLHGARTVRDLDDAYTAKIGGWKSAEEYYDACSSIKNVPGVRIPVVALHAWDDVMIPPAAVPVERIIENPFMLMATTRCGGHVGWTDWHGKSQLDAYVRDFVKAAVYGVEAGVLKKL